MLRNWVFQEEPISFGQVFPNLWKILEVLVPTEKIVVLYFLLVRHINHVVVELSEHVKVGKGYMAAHEKCTGLQMLLKVLL